MSEPIVLPGTAPTFPETVVNKSSMNTVLKRFCPKESIITSTLKNFLANSLQEGHLHLTIRMDAVVKEKSFNSTPSRNITPTSHGMLLPA